MNSIVRNWKRLVYATKGILYAVRYDYSYRTQVYCGLVAIVVFVYLINPLSQTELLFLGLSWTLILITELQNSSFEAALDHLHPELHDNIGHSKDMAAGAVLTAGLFAVFVVLIIIWL